MELERPNEALLKHKLSSYCDALCMLNSNKDKTKGIIKAVVSNLLMLDW
jgi:hypothetical protein